MTQEAFDKVLLDNEHSVADCWNPYYHREPFRTDLGVIFEDWYRKQYSKNDNERLSYKVVPLCVFGGVSFNKDYVQGIEARGTYWVCPKCKLVGFAGYDDQTGLGPRNCINCKTRLALNCYFQPVEIFAMSLKPGKIDPKRDPWQTIAEVCAYVPQGIPQNKLICVIVILTDEKLLLTGEFVNDITFGGGNIYSKTIRDRFWPGHRWAFFDNLAVQWDAKITDQGKKMLKARGIKQDPRTRARLKELLAMPDNRLYALVLRAVAHKIDNA